MKKIKLADANDNTLYPATDFSIIKNCPISDDLGIIGIPSEVDSLTIKGEHVIIDTHDFGFDSVTFSGKRIHIVGDVKVSDPNTNSQYVDIKDYPIDISGVFLARNFLGMVVPATKPTGEYFVYPGFYLYPEQTSPIASSYVYYVNENGKLAKMNPNTQKFVPLGSKTIY